MSRLYFIFSFLLAQNILKAQTDTIPPSIFCPPNDTVTLAAGGICTFQYFYTVTSSDNLPGDTLIQVTGLVSGADFPLGNTINIFQAIDAAGNTASCSFQLTVMNYPGGFACNGAGNNSQIIVSLDSTCTWIPTAINLIDSYFGCIDSNYFLEEVDKIAPYGNGPWVPIEFGPNDVGKTYIFRVLDTIYGNSCTGNIQIRDFLDPKMTCDSFAISCVVDDVSPYFLRDSLGIATAVPTATDACSPSVNLQHLDVTIPMDCTSGFVGIINRKWTAQDDFGNSSTCIQHIQLIRPTLADLRFPPDTMFHCVDGAVPTANTGLPYLEFAGKKFTNLCNLGTAFSDSTIQISPCSKQVLRTWFAIDWCNGDALDTVQVIDVEDKTGPVFLNCPANLTVTASAPNCLANVDLPDFILADACSYVASVQAFWQALGMADTLTSTLSDFPGNDLNNPDTLAILDTAYNLLIGITNIEYVATDECGKTSKCSFNLQVWDGVPPDAICHPSLTLPLGYANASWFNLASIDECATVQTMKARHENPSPCQSNDQFYDNVEFCCADIGDTILVRMRVYDFLVPSGAVPLDFAVSQSSDCFVKVLIQDPNMDCDSLKLLDVTGKIKTESDNPVANVKMTLEVTPPASSGFDLQTQTNQNGHFLFQYLPENIDYTLTPSKNNNPLDGVSTYDLVLISKHILALDTLDSPYKLIAADANKSNSITTFDIVELRKLILGIYSALPNNSSWRFVDKDFVFPDLMNPFSTPFPESIPRTNVLIDQLEEDFIGIKVGDVNGTALGDSLLAADDRTELYPWGGGRGRILFFKINDKKVEAGEEFTARFTAAEKASGWQFTLNLKDLEVVEILPGERMSRDNFAVFEDAVTTSVEKEARDFAITFRARRAGQLSEMLAVSSRITRAEAYQLTTDDLRPTISEVALLFDNRLISKVGFELYQNQPNPFSDRTLIGFHLPEASDATLTVFDETGRVVHSQSASYPQGYHSISLEKSLFNGAGVFFYKLETPTDSAVRKMFLLR